MNRLVTKCDCCHADIEFAAEQQIARCPFCRKRLVRPGSTGAPLRDLERANELWADCRFDEAAEAFRAVLRKNPGEYDARWKLMLCKYGVQYVTEERTGAQYIICHVARPQSLRSEAEYQHALDQAPPEVRARYEEDAAYIDAAQAEIRRLKEQEERPCEVFICFKETDERTGERTQDSLYAETIYNRLTDLGYRVFYSNVTLAEKAGKDYEAAIYQAIDAARVMLVIGTARERFEATWVKSEWTRFLKRQETEVGKLLIPLYKGSATTMPDQFTNMHLEGIDLQTDFLTKIENRLHRRLRKAERDRQLLDDLTEQVRAARAEAAEAAIQLAAAQESALTASEQAAERLAGMQAIAEQTSERLRAAAEEIARMKTVESRLRAALTGVMAQNAALRDALDALRTQVRQLRDHVAPLTDILDQADSTLSGLPAPIADPDIPGEADPDQPLTLDLNPDLAPEIQELFHNPGKPARPAAPPADPELERLARHGLELYDQGNFKQAFPTLLAAANRGHLGAQTAVGVMYQTGRGVPKDPAEAIKWYEKAANRADAMAQYNLGQMYDLGDGVPINQAEAARWYRRAADQGDPDAQFCLGVMHLVGAGVPKNRDDASMWLRKAAAQGHQKAVSRLKREGIPMEAPAAPDAEALAQRGVALYSERKFRDALDPLLAAADQGHAEAQYLLGQMHEHGNGTPRSLPDAERWYAEAAKHHHPKALLRLAMIAQTPADKAKWLQQAASLDYAQAQFDLAELYWYGDSGVPKDRAQAIELYRKAAAQGHQSALNRLRSEGVSVDASAPGPTARQSAALSPAAQSALMRGLKVYRQKNYKQALDLLFPLANDGNAEAQFTLAEIYAHGGLGVPVDQSASLYWYGEAAGQGYADAQFALADIYAHGSNSVPKDPALARQWYMKAAAQGHRLAINRLKREGIEVVVK